MPGREGLYPPHEWLETLYDLGSTDRQRQHTRGFDALHSNRNVSSEREEREREREREEEERLNNYNTFLSLSIFRFPTVLFLLFFSRFPLSVWFASLFRGYHRCMNEYRDI